MRQITVSEREEGQRLDRYLSAYLKEAGKGFLYKMMRKKNITLNGRKCDGAERLSAGDEIRLFFSEETLDKFRGTGADGSPGPGTERALPALSPDSVIYEDSHVLLVNKPSGMLTQKSRPGDVSLNERMIAYLLRTGKLTERDLETFHPSVCNRLDRNTSGIVLCGISAQGLRGLSQMIRERQLRKFYLACAAGVLRRPLTLHGYLYKDEEKNQVRIWKETEPHPDEAEEIYTAYRPLAISDQMTLLEVELITGKTHQIRAHLSSIGHPLLGDSKYGNALSRELSDRYHLRSQMLHAGRVEFPDAVPPGLERLRGKIFTAPTPGQMETLMRSLRLCVADGQETSRTNREVE